MSVFSKIIDVLCEIYRIVCMIFLAGFIAIVLVSIFFRYVINDSLIWSEQVCRYLFVWMIMLGAPVVYRKGRDVSFDMIVKLLHPGAQHVIKMIVDVGVGFLGVFMGYQGMQYCLSYGSKILAGIEIPQWLMYISQPVCGYTLAVVCLESFILGIIFLAKKNKKAVVGKGGAE